MGPNKGGGATARKTKPGAKPSKDSKPSGDSGPSKPSAGSSRPSSSKKPSNDAKKSDLKKQNNGGSSSKLDAAVQPADSVGMSRENMAMLQNLFATQLGMEDASIGGDGGSLHLQRSMTERAKFENDLHDMLLADVTKKGFAPLHFGGAWQVVHAQALQGGDFDLAFNPAKKLLKDRMMEYLLCNLSEEQLPPSYRQQVRKGSAKPSSTASKASKAVTETIKVAQPAADLSRKAAATTVAHLFAAGFDVAAAKEAVQLYPQDQFQALEHLCKSFRPSVAASRELMLGAGSWIGAVNDTVTAEMKAMAEIMGPEGQFGCCEGATLIRLNAPAEGLPAGGQLEVHFNAVQAPLYPFEPPHRLVYCNPEMGFPAVAAVTAALWKRSVQLCGEPQLFELVTWINTQGAAVVAKAHSKLEKVLAREGMSTSDIPAGRVANSSQARPSVPAFIPRSVLPTPQQQPQQKQQPQQQQQQPQGVIAQMKQQQQQLPPQQQQQQQQKPKLAQGIIAQLKQQQPQQPQQPPPLPSPALQARALGSGKADSINGRPASGLKEGKGGPEGRRDYSSSDRSGESSRSRNGDGAAALLPGADGPKRARGGYFPPSKEQVRVRNEALLGALEDWESSTERKASAMREQRQRLPSWKQQDEVVSTCVRSQVVVISGETGCGKTTQVPQFLLDAATRSGTGGSTNIVCTQPRRLSATSVAQRVAAERCEAIGKTVGYAIRMESSRSADTRLLFCTTGVLVRRMIDDPSLEGTTHVIVDEVHERSLDSDFLLVLLKQMLQRRPDIRLILMSATVNESAFSTYFGGCPVLHIPGFTHPVKEMFLEDVIKATKYMPDQNSDFCRKGPPKDALGAPKGSGRLQMEGELAAADQLKNRGYGEKTVSAIKLLDPEKLNYDLMVATIRWIITNGEEGAILVFMPGLMEITKLNEACLTDPTVRAACGGGRYIIALHSALAASGQDQNAAFEAPPKGMRKIVIATNIAETSITIEDCVYVVDTGRVKENRYSSETHMEALVECFVSRASARQRRGRAGRVKPGHCLRLFTRHMHDEVMTQEQIPEILRVPLEGLVLQIKLLRMAEKKVQGVEPVQAFLSQCIEPPSAEAVAAAVRALGYIGALKEEEGGVQELSPLGRHLATLPVDVRVGKMLIYAAMLGCLDPITTIAAAMTLRSPFVSPLEKRDEADAAKASFGKPMQSDLLAVLSAYNGWIEACKQGRAAERTFVNDSFLSFKTLQGIKDMKGQFRRLLVEAGFVMRGNRGGGSDRYRGGGEYSVEADSDSKCTADAHASNLLMVRAVLVAGLYPNVVRVQEKPGGKGGKSGGPPKLFVQVQLPGGRSEEQAVQIHPSSVNFSETKFSSPWLLYREIVQTKATYLRDCTVITPYPLLLFGGSIQVQVNDQTVSVDRWIKLKCQPRVALLFQQLRAQLERLLLDKIERPSMDLWAEGGTVLGTILQLINTEKEV